MLASEARRIGLILHDFPAGGTERIAIRLADRWSRAGREVTIFCGTTAGPALAEVPDHVRLLVADPPIPRSMVSRLRLGRWLRATLVRHPVDVLVAPGNFHLPVLFAAGRLPCPVVAKLSNPLGGTGRIGAGMGGIERRLVAGWVDRFVAMSPALARQAGQEIARSCAVLTEPILPVPPVARQRPVGPPIVLCAGRLVLQKRFSLALRTFAAMNEDRATLIILGDGPERSTLERQARALGIADQTRFVGHVPDITPWLGAVHAFLLTSSYEGYPAVLVEAIAAGVPVVATPCSDAMAEIIAAPARGVVAAAEPLALVTTLRRVLAGSGVEEASWLALVEQHDATKAAGAWLAMLDGIVAKEEAPDRP